MVNDILDIQLTNIRNNKVLCTYVYPQRMHKPIWFHYQRLGGYKA